MSFLKQAILFVLLCMFVPIPLLHANNLSTELSKLESEYKNLHSVLNDPNLVLLKEVSAGMLGLNRQLVSLEELVKAIADYNFRNNVDDNTRRATAELTYFLLNNSNIMKDSMEVELIKIESRINEIRKEIAQQNNELFPPNSQPSNSSFDGLLENLTSEEHLASLDFDKILADNGGGATPIASSQVDSFDGDWNEAINNYYSSCPKRQPDDRRSFRAYPNGQTSGNTYRECVYFPSGDIKREASFMKGKQDGLRTEYVWSSKFNFPHVSNRTNYSNGKRDGLMEFYSLTKNGAVYRKRFETYADGKLHGDGAKYFENGRTEEDLNYFNGKIIKKNVYRQDGSFSYCVKWGNDGYPRDCKTGKISN